MVFQKENFKNSIFLILLIGSLAVSCNSLGIPLEKKRHLPINPTNGCEMTSEERTYRVLFLLPIYSHVLDSDSASSHVDQFELESNSYAKPWDIVVTTLGFLLSFNSSTEIKVYCPKSVVLESIKREPNSDTSSSKLSYWKPEGQPTPIQMVSFVPDDYKITEESKSKLIALSREILKSEEPFKVVLVGKSQTTGDLAYQVRLVKRRFDEVKQVLSKESIDENRIRTFISDRETSGSIKEISGDTPSTIHIYLIKE
ncbi:cell envelope biogenesis protein OmpA [Leptospira sp. 2 VSF19]|uniref:Cell envelope biogenesis protein OmpA n=1 Tax=Leptospira soteropolitanensis TaxID=2950025 RepID=A0AAW5VLW7_9LEPT|nr:cell envelope biogenesis protein OmpA [Leptospira soteropolitanensis]MCW7493551.1 cell envelope biogenesis protein OmpA [Leptospira soteropolitanensis]MCW7500918.1 cell envelope biogenesis protein OmpA [Leptospira soteropolitanensis]MCW7523402.1 cell envelope biogenesis protein OmpA [Leptospira soteropolitanensis]MCW7527263.1 cell envelope biogenesis protein OmpA [Leptospira soteropolitanensis]MCW7531120.1 cell envelope biogenesis protein OmpA [Leptospira soteropolitanensis]